MKDVSDRFIQELQRLEGSCQSIRKDLQAVLSTKSDGTLPPVIGNQDRLFQQVQTHMENMTQLETELQRSLRQMSRGRIESPVNCMRHFPRYSRRLPVRFKTIGQTEGWTHAFTQDIAAMGLFVLCPQSRQKGDVLQLEVDLSDTNTVVLQGHVAWSKWVPPGLHGVQSPGFGVKVTQAPGAWFAYFMAQGKT